MSSGRVAAADLAEWHREPCAVHGNGGDGKEAHKLLMQSWHEAVTQRRTSAVQPNYYSWAIVTYQKGDKEGALKLFELASEDGSWSWLESTYNLGVVQKELGHMRQAQATFEKVLSVEPANLSAMVNLVQLLLEQDAWGEAKQLVQQCVQQHPTSDLARQLHDEVMASAASRWPL